MLRLASKKNLNKPQSGDVIKEKNVNEIVDDFASSWSSKEEQSDSSIDQNVSQQDRSVFLAAMNQFFNWIGSVRTPVKATTPSVNQSISTSYSAIS